MQFDMDLHVDYAKAGLPVTPEQPWMNVYLHKPSDEMPAIRRKPMMIVCPGGGYQMRSDREAEPIALQWMAAGYHTATVHYCVLPSPYPTAVLQLAEAVRQVRLHADEWNVIPDQVYIMGFSAGGHLACTLGTLWNDPLFHDMFGDDQLWKPNAQVLSYPVVTMGEKTHAGSRKYLLGDDPDPALVEKLSLENSVSPDTVPTFIWHTMEDTVVPVENTLWYACSLRRHGVPFEMHVYENGPHGLATCAQVSTGIPNDIHPTAATWIPLAMAFLDRRK